MKFAFSTGLVMIGFACCRCAAEHDGEEGVLTTMRFVPSTFDDCLYGEALPGHLRDLGCPDEAAAQTSLFRLFACQLSAYGLDRHAKPFRNTGERAVDALPETWLMVYRRSQLWMFDLCGHLRPRALVYHATQQIRRGNKHLMRVIASHQEAAAEAASEPSLEAAVASFSMSFEELDAMEQRVKHVCQMAKLDRSKVALVKAVVRNMTRIADTATTVGRRMADRAARAEEERVAIDRSLQRLVEVMGSGWRAVPPRLRAAAAAGSETVAEARVSQSDVESVVATLHERIQPLWPLLTALVFSRNLFVVLETACFYAGAFYFTYWACITSEWMRHMLVPSIACCWGSLLVEVGLCFMFNSAGAETLVGFVRIASVVVISLRGLRHAAWNDYC